MSQPVISSSIRHVIWDWNGTLFDDVALCLDIMNSLLRQRGLPALSLDIYLEQFCFPLENFYRKVGFDFEAESFNDVGSLFIAEYAVRHTECLLQPGVSDVLEYFRMSEIPQSLLSAFEEQSLKATVKWFGLGRYFGRLVGHQHIYARSKIENGRILLARLGCRKEEALMIGDTFHDAEVAAELGTHCLLVAKGHNSREQLERAGVPVLDSLFDLIPAACSTEGAESGYF